MSTQSESPELHSLFYMTDRQRRNARIICGNSHPGLAKDLSNLLGIKLVDCELQYFSNSEIRPVIKESIRGKNIFIIQTGTFNRILCDRSVNDHLMETFLLIRACKRADSKNITLIMPNMPYARQDKKDNPRGGISARDIADILEICGITRVICLDLHCAQIQGFFNVPCDNLFCNNLIKNVLFDKVFRNSDNYKENYVVISPDEGALKRAKQFANSVDLPFMVLSKERDYTKLNMVENMFLIGNKKYLKNRTAIIIDDMCDTFGTVQKAANCLIENGAKSVILAITHGIFSGPAIERMNNTDTIEMVICSNSIPQTENTKRCNKLVVFSVANLISSVIASLITGNSISRLFEDSELKITF